MVLFTILLSHINQKTQFENPVMEAKRKLSTDPPTGASPQPEAAAPPGNSRSDNLKVSQAGSGGANVLVDTGAKEKLF